MPAVFVHGVPDTQRVWRALITRLRRDDVVTLSLPGFGCEIPTGFDCSKEAYCDWLLRELDNIDRPIDLVAHDWGAILALRATSLEPTLVRTWAVAGARTARTSSPPSGVGWRAVQARASFRFRIAHTGGSCSGPERWRRSSKPSGREGDVIMERA